MKLTKGEIRKDAVQSTIEAAATTVGSVSTIITSAVRDVTKALGGFGTELFEIRESARRASRDSQTDEPGHGSAERQIPRD